MDTNNTEKKNCFITQRLRKLFSRHYNKLCPFWQVRNLVRCNLNVFKHLTCFHSLYSSGPVHLFFTINSTSCSSYLLFDLSPLTLPTDPLLSTRHRPSTNPQPVDILQIPDFSSWERSEKHPTLPQ